MVNSILPDYFYSTLNCVGNRLAPLCSSVNSVFHAALPTSLTASAGYVFSAIAGEELFSTEAYVSVGSVAAVAVCGLGLYRYFYRAEMPASAAVEMPPQPAVVVVKPKSLVKPKPPVKPKPLTVPIGLPNGGNHCCFISLFQLFMNTPSWVSVLEGCPALKDVLAAYRAGDTSGLNLQEVRRGIDIGEVNHFINQEDPAAYGRVLAHSARRQLQLTAGYYSSDGTPVSDERRLPPDDPFITLGIPSGGPVTLTRLLEDYFYSHFEGKFSFAEDKLIEQEGESTFIRKSIDGPPPQDLILQLKRFRVETPQFSRAQVETPRVSSSWFQQFKIWFLQLLGFYKKTPESSPSTTPREFQDRKVIDRIETPFILEMKSEWFSDEKKPVCYQCQSFLCHQGSSTKSGHYISYVLKAGVWYECNDSSVRKISTEYALERLQESYMISYGKI